MTVAATAVVVSVGAQVVRVARVVRTEAVAHRVASSFPFLSKFNTHITHVTTEKDQVSQDAKGSRAGLAYRGSSIDFGSFAIKSLEQAWITARQIEAARIAMTRAMKREGQVWIRIFPDKPITKKPAEVRMGKGKGSPEYWVACVKPGTIMFESDGVTLEVAQESLRLAAQKLPVRTSFVVRRDYVDKQVR